MAFSLGLRTYRYYISTYSVDICMGQTRSGAASRQVFNLLGARVVYLVPKASFILGRLEMTEPVKRRVFTVYFHTELTVTSNKGQKLT